MQSEPSTPERSRSRLCNTVRSYALLWLGIGIGLAAAISSIARPAAPITSGASNGPVAVVNGQPVSRFDYQAALRAVAARAGHDQPTAADEQRALEQVIEDELMLERGIELGMVRGDPQTRQALLSAVFAAERAAAQARIPSESELQAFYTQIRSALERPGKLHMRQLLVRASTRAELPLARERADTAVRRLRAGEPFAKVAADLGELGEKPLPDAEVTPEQLRALIGPVTLEHALRLQPGEVSSVIGGDRVLRVLVMVAREPRRIPPLSEVRDEVILRYRLQAADAAFAAKIRALRARAKIVKRVPSP